MVKKSFRLVLIALFMLISIAWNNIALADSAPSNSFSISPLHPETEEPQSTYYDLSMKPGENKNIKIRIFNDNNHEIKVNVQANDASTNMNGVISYTGEDKRDSSLKVPYSTIAHLDQNQVTVPKKSYYDATIHIKMPDQKFLGTILGGIRVTASDTKSNSTDAPAVKANIAYSVAVVIKESDSVVEPDMHLLGVVKEVRDYREYISAELQNAAPRLIKNLEANAIVYKEGSTQAMYQAQKSEMEMAPNSRFNFGINLENHSFKPGKYTMKISGKADGKPYSFTKNFTISSKEARTYNKNAIYASDKDSNNQFIIILTIIVGLLVIILLSFLVVLRKKVIRSEDNNE